MKAIRKNRGFTLVEILIVVIILGILAAIVIPQFTNASEDARKSSNSSQLQTLRSQLELFKLQHHDGWPTSDGKLTASSTWDWDKLTTKTEQDAVASPAGTDTDTTNDVGPYLPNKLTNPLNNSTTVANVAADPTAGDSAPTGAGFVLSTATGKLFGVDKDGLITKD